MTHTNDLYYARNGSISRRAAITGLVGLIGTLYADTGKQEAGFDIPEATPAPKELAEKAQKLFEQGRYSEPYIQRHTGNHTDSSGKKLLDCPSKCLTEQIYSKMFIDNERYQFSASYGKVLELGKNDLGLSIYWWSTPKNGRYDGPYQFNHEQKKWFKANWPPKK